MKILNRIEFNYSFHIWSKPYYDPRQEDYRPRIPGKVRKCLICKVIK